MANTQAPGTNGSQFFIIYEDTQLPADYTVLGTITKGLDIVKEVAKAGDDDAFDRQAGGGHPKKEVGIKTLTMRPRPDSSADRERRGRRRAPPCPVASGAGGDAVGVEDAVDLADRGQQVARGASGRPSRS